MQILRIGAATAVHDALTRVEVKFLTRLAVVLRQSRRGIFFADTAHLSIVAAIIIITAATAAGGERERSA